MVTVFTGVGTVVTAWLSPPSLYTVQPVKPAASNPTGQRRRSQRVGVSSSSRVGSWMPVDRGGDGAGVRRDEGREPPDWGVDTSVSPGGWVRDGLDMLFGGLGGQADLGDADSAEHIKDLHDAFVLGAVVATHDDREFRGSGLEGGEA